MIRNARRANPLRIDPTRTGALRKQLVAEIRRRLARLKGQIIRYFDSVTLNEKEYASTQYMVPQVAVQIAEMQAAFSPADVLKTPEPHITVRYGLDAETDPTQVEAIAANIPPVEVQLGKLSLFQNEGKDVLKLEVSGQGLHDAYEMLGVLEHDVLNPVYQPHLTVAYLVSGAGEKYLSLSNPLLGKRLVLQHLQFSDAERELITVNKPLRSDPEQVRAFQRWLRTQVSGKLTDEQLWDAYAKAGFKKGQARAYDDVKAKMPKKESLDFYKGSKDQFLRTSFNSPVAKEKVKLLAGRAFDDMEGVTDTMSLRMSRMLTDGLVAGKNPRDIADDLVDEVDIALPRAETIARTEIIRAHAEGQLQSMDDLGVEEVGVAVEWATAGDERVCELCDSLEGVVLKIDEARGMLPRHANCRCAWLPAGVGEDDSDQKDTKKEIDKAIKGAEPDDEWGPGQRISKDRPVGNAFCPTGVGGGVDPSCSPESGSAANPIRCGSDVRYAAEMLARGKHVRLAQPEQVSTLLHKMDKMIRDAEASGQTAPKFDLCKVSAAGSNLFCQENVGVPRVKMPQMRGQPVPGTHADTLPRNAAGKVDIGQQFVESMKAEGTKVDQVDVKASHLRASQTELDGARVLQLMREAKEGKDLRKRPIFVTKDNYIVDGHHHWAALIGLGYKEGKDFKLPVYRLHTDIGTALSKANDFAAKMGLAPKTVAK